MKITYSTISKYYILDDVDKLLHIVDNKIYQINGNVFDICSIFDFSQIFKSHLEF